MAVKSSSRFFIRLTLYTCVAFCVASPTRRQFVTITETTSDPSAAVTKNGGAWDDTDDFDFDGEEWLSEAAVPSSSQPQHHDYVEYNDDDDSGIHHGNVLMGFGDDEEVEEQHAEEDEANDDHDTEFLYLPQRDTRFMLEDDDDDKSGPIKVRHTSKGSYSRIVDQDNSVESSNEGKDDISGQFEFSVEDDHSEKDKEEDNKDDFILEDSQQKEDDSIEVMPRQEIHSDDDDDDFVADPDAEGDPMFENPEEDAAQVIYGDHVFLY